MIFKPTKKIEETLKEKNITYEIIEREESNIVVTHFALDNGYQVQINFISRSNDNDVGIRVLDFIHVPKDKIDLALKTINQLNTEFRFTKFTQENEEIIVQMDVPQSSKNDFQEIVIEYLVRLLTILEESYPILKTAVE